jgi:hypothetical protein
MFGTSEVVQAAGEVLGADTAKDVYDLPGGRDGSIVILGQLVPDATQTHGIGSFADASLGLAPMRLGARGAAHHFR